MSVSSIIVAVNAVLLKGVEDNLDEPRSDEQSAAPEPAACAELCATVRYRARGSRPRPATLPLRANDPAVDHHARVLVLEDVAVEQIELLLLEVV